MKVQCKNDDPRGRGYVCFFCSDLIDPSAQYSFSLCRASDQTFLGKAGWQSAEEKHTPDECRQEGDSGVLHVGPSIVDFLDANENYRLTLYARNLSPQKAAFSILSINRSLRASQGVVPAGTRVETPVRPAGEPEAAPEPEQNPEPAAAPSPPAASGKMPVIAVGLVLLLLAGGGAWWFMRQKPALPPAGEQAAAPEEAPKPAPEAKAEAERDAGRAGREPPVPEKTEQPGASSEEVLSPREQVRRYLRAEPSAQGAMELYRLLADSPEGSREDTRDAAYRLLYFAAQQGDSEAALATARCVDPATPAWGSIPKDGREAWAAYSKVASGKAEAARAMEALKKWLEDEATRGNAQARRWIDEIARDAEGR
jgi:hypothetical protein